MNRILGYMRQTIRVGFATVQEAADSIQAYTANRQVDPTLLSLFLRERAAAPMEAKV